MKNTYGIDPTTAGLGMEEVFNYLYADALSAAPPEGSVEAYWSLIRMYAAAITRTTNVLNGRSRSGAGALIRFLWRRGQHDLTIVTFNQDLVIENAIEEAIGTTRYASIPWGIPNCYSTEFEDLYSARSGAHFSTENDQSIKVLKLHGSLNWVYRARSAEDAKNAIRQPTGAPGCLLRRQVPVELRSRGERRSVHLLPLIVPPIYEKSAHLRNQLESVWRAAESAFSSAQRVIVFGYSFPGADFAAMSMVRRAFMGNDELSEMFVINPDPHIAGQAGSLTQARAVHAFRDLSAFLDGEN
jgi:hypothetical protein